MSQKYPQASTVSTDGTKSERKGREHYSHTKADQRRDKRRREADDRQVTYAGLTVAQRINLAQGRRGESKRELTRLLAIIEPKTTIAPKAKVATSATPLVDAYKVEKAKHTPKSKIVQAAKQSRPSKS